VVRDALVGLEVPLNKVGHALGVDQLEGVGGEAVHVAVGVRSTTVAHQDGDLVEGLVRERDKVPEHVCGLEARGLQRRNTEIRETNV
jgi:hypothetical protein